LPAEDLISQRAIREWNTWTKRIAGDGCHALPPSSLDTVGGLALDADGALAAGVSRCASVL
jgi:isoaspartyl peptidase/L-asparaginase-like protein (Ntn-hydrolase superfamily)